MEQGAVADGLVLIGKSNAAVAHGFVELIEAVEVVVDQRLVEEFPQMFGRLQLGTVRRLEDEPDAVGDAEVVRPMPTGIVELQHDALGGASADILGKIGEDRLEHLFANRCGNVPYRLASRRFDEAGDIQPFEAVLAKRYGTLALPRPDAPDDRLQADAVFIGRPQLDGRLGMLKRLRLDGAFKLFLSAARSGSPAACGCRGRGFCTE